MEGSHEPIIDPEIWENVQHILDAATVGRSDRIFSRMVFCGHCNGLYGAKTWHSTSKYKRIVWKCNDRYENEHPRPTPTVTDQLLKRAWIQALTELVKRRNRIDWKELHACFTDTASVETEIIQLQDELEIVTGLMEKAIDENKKLQQDQAEYLARFALFEDRYQKLVTKLDQARDDLQRKQATGVELGRIRRRLNRLEMETLAWDEPLYKLITSRLVVSMDGSIRVEFKTGI